MTRLADHGVCPASAFRRGRPSERQENLLVLGVCVVLGMTGLASAQEQEARPLFRGGVEVVAVDVTVVDDDGAPVTDLQPDDFVLEVEGDPRRIVSAEYMSRLPSPEAASLGPPPSHFSSNEDLGAGRLIMLVIDQGNIRRGNGRAAVKAGKEFLDTLTRGDRVGLVVIPAPGENIPFTTDRAAVKEALDHVAGTNSPTIGRYVIGISEAVANERNDLITWDRAVTRECSSELGSFGVDGACAEYMELEARALLQASRQRVAHSLSQLQALMRGLGRIGGPKTLIYISEGMLLDFDLHQMSWLPEVAAASHVTLYAIHLDRSLLESTRARLTSTLMEDNDLELRGLEALSGLARGAMFRATGTPTGSFRRIARELSGDYLLSFEPEGDDREARPHGISVKVRRKGVIVRARPEFRADAPTMASTADTVEEQLAEVLRSPFPATELPIRTTSYTILDQESSLLKLIVVSEIDEGVTEPAELSVQTVLLDQTGRMAATAFDRIAATPLDPWQPSRLQHTMAFLVEPGQYLLRFAAVDDAGRRGSVDHRIHAELTRAGDLRLGDLMLAEVIDDPDATFRPRVDTDGQTEAIATYFELYPDDPDRLVDADITLEILPSLSEGDTEPLFDQPANLRDTDDERRFTADAMVPVSLLAPGSYVARAVVRVGGENVGHVDRPFRITSRGPTAVAADAAEATPGAAPTSAGIGTLIDAFDPASVLEGTVVTGFLDRMSALQETPPTSPTRIAMEHARQGRFGEILTDASPMDDWLLTSFLEGLAFLSRGELEQAASQFRTSMLESSRAYPAMFYLGVCYAAGGRERDAIGAWQTSLITETQSPIIYQVLSDSLMRLNDAEQAIVILEEALNLWPEDGTFKRQLARAQAATGQEVAAFAMLVEYLDHRPGAGDSLFLALRILYESYTRGLTLTTPETDREHLHRYAAAYRAAGGPQQPLVAEWVKLISEASQ